jgi:hypothetical protein
MLSARACSDCFRSFQPSAVSAADRFESLLHPYRRGPTRAVPSGRCPVAGSRSTGVQVAKVRGFVCSSLIRRRCDEPFRPAATPFGVDVSARGLSAAGLSQVQHRVPRSGSQRTDKALRFELAAATGRPGCGSSTLERGFGGCFITSRPADGCFAAACLGRSRRSAGPVAFSCVHEPPPRRSVCCLSSDRAGAFPSRRALDAGTNAGSLASSRVERPPVLRRATTVRTYRFARP